MEDTMKLFCKWLNKEINVPTTFKFPKGKFVWNVGYENPFVKQGFVPVCLSYGNTVKVNPNTFEFVFVGGWKNAKTVMQAASSITIGPNYLDDMQKYVKDKKYEYNIMERAIEIINRFS